MVLMYMFDFIPMCDRCEPLNRGGSAQDIRLATVCVHTNACGGVVLSGLLGVSEMHYLLQLPNCLNVYLGT